MTLRNLWQNWCTFFFAPQSPLPVCVFRICWGLIILQTAVVQLWPDYLLYYGDNAAINVDAVIANYMPGIPEFDLFLILPHGDQYKYILLAALIVTSATLAIGLFSKFSNAVVFLILLSMHRHSPVSINSGDVMVRIGTLMLLLCPAGNALSVDSLITNFRRDWRLTGFHAQPVVPWGQRMLQLETCLAYWVTFFGKLGGPQWVDGSAVYIVIRQKEFFTDLPIFSFMESAWACKLLCWYTLVVEFSLSVLIWFQEIRYFILLNAVLLHLGIAWMVNVGMFEETFLALLILFIEPEHLQKVLDKLQSFFAARSKQTILYDGSCPLCVSWVGTLHRLDYRSKFDLLDRNEAVESSSRAAGGHFYIRDGEMLKSDFAAVRTIFLEIPVLWLFFLLSHLPGMTYLGTTLSRQMHARNCQLIGAKV